MNELFVKSSAISALSTEFFCTVCPNDHSANPRKSTGVSRTKTFLQVWAEQEFVVFQMCKMDWLPEDVWIELDTLLCAFWIMSSRFRATCNYWDYDRFFTWYCVGMEEVEFKMNGKIIFFSTNQANCDRRQKYEEYVFCPCVLADV